MKNSLFIALISFIFIPNTVLATLSNNQSNTEQRIEKLDKINFLPNLLPVIISNSDILELTDKQLNKLLTWRNTNREKILSAMNKVIDKRIKIKEASLSPKISSARLIQMQNEIFQLQRQLLDYKLSCRDLLINTFNASNWEEFFLVLADTGIGITLPESHMTK